MFSGKLTATLVLALLLALVPPFALASSSPASPRPIRIEQIVGVDGTIDLHRYRGRVATDDWSMRVRSDGAPIFVPVDAVTRTASNDSRPNEISESLPNACWSGEFAGGISGEVRAVLRDAGANLYVGGSFVVAGGVIANRIARWNGTTWSPLGSGMDGIVHALAMDGSGNLYAGGLFTTAGGVTANCIARWNGTTWSPLGSGMDEFPDSATRTSGCAQSCGSPRSPPTTGASRPWTALGSDRRSPPSCRSI